MSANQPQVTQLQIETLQEGTGDVTAEQGDTITVHYRGTFLDGREFDASSPGNPISFQLSRGALIDGWIDGIPGMKVGETRRLVIPSDLAYGAQGYPPVIPPNTPLEFEIELVDVQKAEQE